MPTDQKYASMVRRFRQPAILTLAIGFTLTQSAVVAAPRPVRTLAKSPHHP